MKTTISLFSLGLVLAFPVACATDDADSANGGAGSGGSAGSTGGKGSGGTAGSTGGKGSGGSNSGGSAGTDSPSDGGEAGSSGGSSGSGGGSSGSGGAGGGSGGSAGSSSGPDGLDELCSDWMALHEQKTEELDCTSNDSTPIANLCAVSGSCMDELQANYDCEEAATTWSCDTGDGHAQTNGACTTEQAAYFACLQVAVHEEDPFGCAAAAAEKNEIAMSLGCNTDEEIEGTCNQLYLRELCVEPWEAVVECLQAGSDDDFECDGDNDLTPTICETERDAYDACFDSLS